MELTLKNIKHARSLSEETNAFTATLCADGKPIAEARNDGQGGQTFVYARPECRAALQAAEDYAKALPPEPNKWDPEHPLAMSLDFWIDLQIERDLTVKEAQRLLNSGRILIEKGGKLYKTGKATPAQRATYKPREGERVLTTLEDLLPLLED